MNEEWPRAFPNLPSLLEERFYLVDPVDGYQADHHEYNRTRPATLIAEPRAAFVRSGGHGLGAPRSEHI